jgi:hypothetical protein
LLFPSFGTSLVTKSLSRTLLVAAVLGPIAGLPGCGPDNPKMVELPPDKVPPPQKESGEPPKRPDGSNYGASKKYQDLMPK